jgi:2-hydroxycyclohexanecarboxyl-CoA dehydrogenase
VALVTGAASGIGAATAAWLSARGWSVAGVDLEESRTDLPLRVDVSDRGAVEHAARRAEAELGTVELLVTVAGYYEMCPIADISVDAWRRMLHTHLGGTVHACRSVLPGMLAAGDGAIVTVSSELALGGGSEDAHYAAAKGAIIGFTKSLAAEVAGSGVRVNSVAPGPTDTPLLAADSPWRAPEYLATLPLRRLVTPAEVAATVGFLAGDGSYFTGQIVSPNAGAVI